MKVKKEYKTEGCISLLLILKICLVIALIFFYHREYVDTEWVKLIIWDWTGALGCEACYEIYWLNASLNYLFSSNAFDYVCNTVILNASEGTVCPDTFYIVFISFACEVLGFYLKMGYSCFLLFFFLLHKSIILACFIWNYISSGIELAP